MLGRSRRRVGLLNGAVGGDRARTVVRLLDCESIAVVRSPSQPPSLCRYVAPAAQQHRLRRREPSALGGSRRGRAQP